MMASSSNRSIKRKILRTVTRSAAVLIAAGVVATGAYVVVHEDPSKTAAAAPIFKTVAVTAGNLTTSEKIDGSLELSTSTAILHRIEGQTSSSTTGTATSGAAPAGPAGNSANYSAVIGAALVESIRAAADCVAMAGGGTGGDPSGATTTTTTPVTSPTTTSPTTTPVVPVTDPAAPAGSDPIDQVTTTTTTTPTTTPTTVPASDCTTTTVPTGDSVPTDETSTTVVGGPGGGGGGFGGSGGGSASGGGTGSSGSGTTATTSRITQTVTSVTHVGAPAGLGDVLYSVDSSPVVVLSGALPAWRTFEDGMDDGPDVQQLESSLVSLGYDPDGAVTVDDVFDDDTIDLIERWQVGLGVDDTGVVALGSVVFLPTTTTVTGVSASVGDAVGDGDTIVTVAASTKQIVIDVPDGDEAFLTPGLEVTVGNGTGVVSLLRSSERDGAVVVQAVITPTTDIDGQNGSTVKVTITFDNVDDVLLVPAEALLSHLDGTYAVQVQDAAGEVSWHEVELLGVSGNDAGVRGDGIAAGTLVLVPV